MTSADSVRVARPLFQAEGDGAIPISALQLLIVPIDIRLAMELNALWHSRLPETDFDNLTRVRYSAFFAAEFANRYYATAIWTSPVARNVDYDHTIELRRMAIAADAPKNTGSRMLRIMRKMVAIKFPEIANLISYQDTEVHAGTIYKAAGWRIANVSRAGDEWNRKARPRKACQTTASKVRWEILAPSLRPV